MDTQPDTTANELDPHESIETPFSPLPAGAEAEGCDPEKWLQDLVDEIAGEANV